MRMDTCLFYDKTSREGEHSKSFKFPYFKSLIPPHSKGRKREEEEDKEKLLRGREKEKEKGKKN